MKDFMEKNVMAQKHRILCARAARGCFAPALHFILCPSARCLLQTSMMDFNFALIYAPLRVRGRQSLLT